MLKKTRQIRNKLFSIILNIVSCCLNLCFIKIKPKCQSGAFVLVPPLVRRQMGGVVHIPSTHCTVIGQSRPCDARQPITARCEELKAHPKHGGGAWKRIAVTLHHKLCRVVTSCWPEDGGKVDVSRLIVCVRASEPTVALSGTFGAERHEPGDWSWTLEPRQPPSESISYITGGIFETKTVITD